MKSLTKPIGAAVFPSVFACSITVLGAVAFYVWLQQLPGDSPRFLLHPITALSGFLSGDVYTYQQGLGYWTVSATGVEMLIEKSCSGGNFLILSFTMLVFTYKWQPGAPLQQGAAYLTMLFFAYLCTVAASAFRIVSTILLVKAGLGISRTLLHNAIGIITYICMICVCYYVVHKAVSVRKSKKVVVHHG